MSATTTDSLHLVASLAAGHCRFDGGDVDDGDLIPEADWPDLIKLGQRHGLGPLLLKALQGQTSLPFAAELLAPLQFERAEVAVHHILATRAQREIQNDFDHAQIPCVWLKGIVLAKRVYQSPELRPMVDVDVLVPFDQREQALSVAEAGGYSLDRPQLFDGRDGLKHHYYLESSALHPISLELHFRLLGSLDRLLTLDDLAWFWQHTTTPGLACGDQTMVLQPESHLLYLCAHAILQHGEADLRLLRFYDLDRLIVTSQGFDWTLFVDGAVRMRWTYAAQRALALAQDYFDTALPAGLLSELAALRPKSESADHAYRRQSPRTTTQIVVDDLAVMGWSSRVRAAGRIVVPPPSYMRWRYGLHDNRGLPGAYLRRMRRIGTDILSSMRRKGQSSQ